MRKVVTFLGTNPRQTAYALDGQTYSGQVFGEALRQFVDFDEMLVFTTEEAAAKSWPVLEALGDPRVRRIDIPIGRDTGQLWALFDSLTNEVAPGDTVIFDITHGLRSIPFLVFLVAAYLKEARDVKIERIYYGAFELGQPAPVIDLSEFVTLLDWLTATNEFIYTGDGGYLAHLLSKEGQRRDSHDLKRTGRSLEELSLAMMLARPLEVMELAGQVETALASAEADLDQYAKPFALLADRIQREYAARTLPDALDAENAVRNLQQQFALIRWYLENGQIIQAMSLAREWVVTAIGWRLGRGIVLSVGARRDLEWGVNGLARLGRPKLPSEGGGTYTADDLNAEGLALQNWPDAEVLSRLWNQLSTMRNDLDHVGMSPNRSKAANIAKSARRDVLPALEELAAGWGLISVGTNSKES